MASRQVPAQYLKAGADYLEALLRLGLNPDFLGWGWEVATEQWLLVMVTSLIDAGGPLELNRLLFQVYNAGVTPKAISPFMVRVLSPDVVPDGFDLSGEKGLRIDGVNGLTSAIDQSGNVRQTLLAIDLELGRSYSKPTVKNLRRDERRRDWDRFRSNVEGLAA